MLGKLAEVVISIDGLECTVRIGVAPCLWDACVFIPLAFDGFDRALRFANDVNFDAGVCSPKEVAVRCVGEAALLGEFHEDEVLPERADIVAV